jgi:hypothetical protein
MTGRLSGPKGYECRYYAAGRGNNVPKKENVLTGLIRAEPIERAVLKELRDIVLNRPDLRLALKKAIQSTQVARQAPSHLSQLQKELQRKSRQLALLSDSMSYDDAADDPVIRKAELLKADRRRLETQIRMMEGPNRGAAEDPSSTIEHLVEQLKLAVENFENPDLAILRCIIEIFVTRLEADLVTKVVEMEIAVPS